MTNFSDRQRKEVTVFRAKQWNHDRAGPAKLARKILHSLASLPVRRVIIWRKCIRWSKGSWRPSYIWNFGKVKYDGASWFKIKRINGEVDMSSNARNAGSKFF